MTSSLRPRRAVLTASLGLAVATALMPTVPASAATVPVYPDWSLTGASGAFEGTVSMPLGFPATTFTSDSSSAQVPTGASAWLPAGSPVGEVYGSSQGRPYLNARPVANNAGSPSTTTYTFASPTPTSGWAFVMGDVDADQVEISATGADGAPVPVAGFGFQEVFSYCDASPRSSSCAGVVAPYDLPTWQPADGVLVGNSTASDTVGASAWFEPDVALSSLTLTFRWRSGFPVYQTWFAALGRDISGTVTVDGVTPSAGTVLELVGPDGAALDSTTTGPDGAYVFTGLATRPGYLVRVVPPAGFVPNGPAERSADLTTTDAPGTDFDLTAVPSTSLVDGVVSDPDGNPVPDADIDLLTPDGDPVGDATTDLAGRFEIPDVPAGDYLLVVSPPQGLEPLTVPVAVPLDQPLSLVLARSAAPPPVPDPPPDPGDRGSRSPPDELPATGTDLRLSGLGGLLLALGALAVGATRRRPAQPR